MQFHCDLKTYMQTMKKKKIGEINDNKRATIKFFFTNPQKSSVLERTTGSTWQYVNIYMYNLGAC